MSSSLDLPIGIEVAARRELLAVLPRIVQPFPPHRSRGLRSLRAVEESCYLCPSPRRFERLGAPAMAWCWLPVVGAPRQVATSIRSLNRSDVAAVLFLPTEASSAVAAT